MEKKQCTAIVLAAGRGKRMHTDRPKQYLMLEGYPVLYYSLKAFEESPVERIILVAETGEIDYCRKEIVETYGFRKVTNIVAGGKERYHSVYQGLRAAVGSDYVWIHDGARPFLTQEIIRRTWEGVRQYGACVAGMPVKDTIKIADEKGFAIETPERSKVWMVQTPQAFSYDLICRAYETLLEMERCGRRIAVTDDAMVLETVGQGKVKLVEGSYENMKITTSSDLEIAKTLVRRSASSV